MSYEWKERDKKMGWEYDDGESKHLSMIIE